MKNWEKYTEEIMKVLRETGSASFGVCDEKPVPCDKISCCAGCKFKSHKCLMMRKEWLNEEYVEQPKLTQRERQLCEFIETGWITRDKNGYLYASHSKPEKGASTWSVSSCTWINPKVYRVEFPFIKWSDQEPWSVVDLLKLGVIE